MLAGALDRLGRSLSGVIRNIETLAGTGVQLRSLREASTTPPRPAARFADILAALADYERALMHGRGGCSHRGSASGPTHRPAKLTPAQARQCRALRRW